MLPNPHYFFPQLKKIALISGQIHPGKAAPILWRSIRRLAAAMAKETGQTDWLKA
jgi:hypothetical protein